MAAILNGGQRDTMYKDASGTEQKFTVSNFAEAFSLNCNAEAGALAVADTLATLIQTLIRKGVINGTIA